MKYLFCLFAIVSLLLPLTASALTPVGEEFGGYILLSTPCTCTPGIVRVQYSLVYPLLFPWVSRALLLTPATIRFAYQQFLITPPPTAWHLGVFVPVPSLCLIGAPPACAALPADGLIFYTGSSFPGFSIF